MENEIVNPEREGAKPTQMKPEEERIIDYLNEVRLRTLTPAKSADVFKGILTLNKDGKVVRRPLTYNHGLGNGYIFMEFYVDMGLFEIIQDEIEGELIHWICGEVTYRITAKLKRKRLERKQSQDRVGESLNPGKYKRRRLLRKENLQPIVAETQEQESEETKVKLRKATVRKVKAIIRVVALNCADRYVGRKQIFAYVKTTENGEAVIGDIVKDLCISGVVSPEFFQREGHLDIRRNEKNQREFKYIGTQPLTDEEAERLASRISILNYEATERREAKQASLQQAMSNYAQENQMHKLIDADFSEVKTVVDEIVSEKQEEVKQKPENTALLDYGEFFREQEERLKAIEMRIGENTERLLKANEEFNKNVDEKTQQIIKLLEIANQILDKSNDKIS